MPVVPRQVLNGSFCSELREDLVPKDVPVFTLALLVCSAPGGQIRLICLLEGGERRLLHQAILRLPLAIFSGVLAVLPAPGLDQIPLGTCLHQGPLPRTFPIGTDMDLDPFASVLGTARREPSNADEGLASSLADRFEDDIQPRRTTATFLLTAVCCLESTNL